MQKPKQIVATRSQENEDRSKSAKVGLKTAVQRKDAENAELKKELEELKRLVSRLIQ